MGVKGVSNLIALRAMPTPSDVKQRIRTSLKRHAELDAVQIKVETTGSRVTLRGTVRSMAERRDAERAGVISAPSAAAKKRPATPNRGSEHGPPNASVTGVGNSRLRSSPLDAASI